MTTTKQTARKAPSTPRGKTRHQGGSPTKPEVTDWTYLAEKEATELHEDMTAWILEETGIDLDTFDGEPRDLFLKAVQVTAVLRGVYQRSDRNKKREAYRGLPAEVVAQRSAHMTAAHAEATALIEARKAKAAPRKPVAKKSAPKTTTTRKPAAPRKPATTTKAVAK